MRSFIVIIILIVSFAQSHAQNADIRLLRRINLGGNESFDPAFKFTTNSVTPLLIAIPLGSITNYIIKKDSASKSKALFICSSVAVSGIITFGLKYSINRERPFKKYSDIEQETSGGSPSFPSGYTSSAFSLATSLSIAYPKWYVIAPSFLWASTVAYSRMDLGVHYPSDILAGAIVGSGSAYLSYKINKWFASRKSKSSLKNDHE